MHACTCACVQKSPGVWEHYKDMTEDFATGYGYAIATGSSFIMAFYQVRQARQCARWQRHASTISHTGRGSEAAE